MNQKTFYVFPGQGAQYPRMGLDLLEGSGEKGPPDRVKELFSLASELMGRDMAELLANSSPEELKRTDISQPAITVVNLAAAFWLEEGGIRPSGAAGFSLGEYSALCLGGVLSPKDCLFLVIERGKAMQAAIDEISSTASPPGMAAVIGLEPQGVETLIAQWKQEKPGWELYSANINSKRQVVVSGSAAALAEAEGLFKEAGARRFVSLAVAGPYHSPFMEGAAQAFAPFLSKVTFNDPAIPVFSNVTGQQITSGEEAKALALRQIVERVRWTEVEEAITLEAPDQLFETGPGKVLQGLWKDTESPIPCYTVGTMAEILERRNT